MNGIALKTSGQEWSQLSARDKETVT